MNDLIARPKAALLIVLCLPNCASINSALPPNNNSVLPMTIKNGTSAKLSIVPGSNQCMLQIPPRTVLRPNQQWSGQVELTRTCKSNHWFFDLSFSVGFEAAGGTWTKVGSQGWKVIFLAHGLTLKCEGKVNCVFHVTILRGRVGQLVASKRSMPPRHSVFTKKQRYVLTSVKGPPNATHH
jgi:hypothetical protein